MSRIATPARQSSGKSRIDSVDLDQCRKIWKNGKVFNSATERATHSTRSITNGRRKGFGCKRRDGDAAG